jgi:hypothetical protein
MKRITTTITIFCNLAVLLLPSCKKECTSGQNFVVQAPMRVEPQAEEMRLGDTITVTIEVPYNSFDLQKNLPVDIAGFTVSEFGLYITMLNKQGEKVVGEGLDQFTYLFLKGGGRLFNGATLQNTFAVEVDRYIYRIKLVPLRRGLVSIINLRAEARDGCTLVDFSPTCINTPNNYDLYYQLITSVYGSSGYFNDNRIYYIWVK